MRFTSPRRLNRRGVTLVLMAIMIFMALGMAALAIDYGMIKTAKAEAQRAMDSAALAGASAFLINDPTIDKTIVGTDRAKELAVKHPVHSILVDTAGACGVAEVCVEVDLAKEEVTATFTRSNIGLWFAQRFGSATMGIRASATAHVVDAGATQCLMPVAIADKWHNTLPDPAEDINDDGIPDYVDTNGDGDWDYAKGKNGEPWENWNYDPSEGDYYYPPDDANATGYTQADYGQQIVLMQLDPAQTQVSSNYLGWGKDGAAASDSAMRERILNPDCGVNQLNEQFQRAANGSKPNLGQAWADRIARDPSSTWYWDNTLGPGGNVVCPNYANGCPSDWEDISPRVVTIGLYDPGIMLNPQDNTIEFVNFAKMFLDTRPCTGTPGQCKAEVTGRFLGYAEGNGGGPTTGPLVKKLVLIK